MTATATEKRCVRCNRGESTIGFRSPFAQKCLICDDLTEDERKAYYRMYQRAKGQAVARLIERHEDEYRRLLVRARNRVKAEAEEREVLAARAVRRSRRSA